MSGSFNFSNSAQSPGFSSASNRRAPIHNPYDKFTQPQFDAFIGDITGALRKALGGFDYESASKHSTETSITPEPTRSLGSSPITYDPERSISERKGKGRAPTDESLFFGSGDKDSPIEIDEDDEEVSDGSEDAFEEEQDEDAEYEDPPRIVNGQQDYYSGEEEGEEEEDEDEDNSIELISDNEAEAPITKPNARFLDVDEDEEAEEGSGSDAEEGEDYDLGSDFDYDYGEDPGRNGPMLSNVKARSGREEVHEHEDSPSPSPERDITRNSSPFVSTRAEPDEDAPTPLLPDPWDGVREYAEDFYTGGDFVEGSLNGKGVSVHQLTDLDGISRVHAATLDDFASANSNMELNAPPSYDIFDIDEEDNFKEDRTRQSNHPPEMDDDGEADEEDDPTFDELYAEMQQENAGEVDLFSDGIMDSALRTTAPSHRRPPGEPDIFNGGDIGSEYSIGSDQDMVNQNGSERERSQSPEEDEPEDIGFHPPLGTSDLEPNVYRRSSRYHGDEFREESVEADDFIETDTPTKKRVKFARQFRADDFLPNSPSGRVSPTNAESFARLDYNDDEGVFMNGESTPAMDFGLFVTSDADVSTPSPADLEKTDDAIRHLADDSDEGDASMDVTIGNNTPTSQAVEPWKDEKAQDDISDDITPTPVTGELAAQSQVAEAAKTLTDEGMPLAVHSMDGFDPTSSAEPALPSVVVTTDELIAAPKLDHAEMDHPAIIPPVSADPNAPDPTILDEEASLTASVAHSAIASGLFTPGDISLAASPCFRDDDDAEASREASKSPEIQTVAIDDLPPANQADSLSLEYPDLAIDPSLTDQHMRSVSPQPGPETLEESDISSSNPASPVADAHDLTRSSFEGPEPIVAKDHEAHEAGPVEDFDLELQYPEEQSPLAEREDGLTQDTANHVVDEIDNRDAEGDMDDEVTELHKDTAVPDPTDPNEDPFRLMGSDSAVAPGEVQEENFSESSTPANENSANVQPNGGEELHLNGFSNQFDGNVETVERAASRGASLPPALAVVNSPANLTLVNGSNKESDVDSDTDIQQRGIKWEQRKSPAVDASMNRMTPPLYEPQYINDIKGKGKAKEIETPLSPAHSRSSSSDASSARRLLDPGSGSSSRASSVYSDDEAPNSSPVIQPKFDAISAIIRPRTNVLLHRHSRPNAGRQHPNLPSLLIQAAKNESLALSPSTGADSSKSELVNDNHRSPTTPSHAEHQQRASTSSNSPVTRSNCRFRRISLPREEGGPRVHFVVPGCSLGDKNLMDAEEIVDHGDATLEDGDRMIKDIENLEFNSDLIGVLRQLVGVDLLREQEVAYLPQIGEEPPRRKLGSLGRRSGRESLGPMINTGPSLRPSLDFSSPSSSGMRPPVSKSGSITTSTTSGSRRTRDHQDPAFSPRSVTDSMDWSDPERSPKAKRQRRSRIDKDSPELSDSVASKTIVISKKPGKRTKRISVDAAAYKPEADETEEESEEDLETQKRKKKSRNRGVKRNRTADGVATEGDGADTRKPKKQKKRAEVEGNVDAVSS